MGRRWAYGTMRMALPLAMAPPPLAALRGALGPPVLAGGPRWGHDLIPRLPPVCDVAIVALYLLFIPVAVWAHRDARRRGQEGPLWGTVVFLLPVLGLLIYLRYRPREYAPPPGHTPVPPGDGGRGGAPPGPAPPDPPAPPK